MIRNLLAVLAVVGCLWLMLVYVTHFTQFGRIDACLDDGGRWDREQDSCVGARSTP